MLSAETIADYIISKTDTNNLKLQKLLFYVNLEYKKRYRKLMFSEQVVRWRYGPVVEKIYRKYKFYSDRPLPKPEKPVRIPEKEKRIIDQVIRKYSNLSAFELSRMSLKEKIVQNTELDNCIKF